MTEGLTIPAALANEMLAHARAELPNEACGVLSGSVADGKGTAYHPARNADASPYVYTVHPDDLIRIVLGIEEAGRDLVAIFHSHTRTAAVPSATDRRSARYPNAFYLIASLTNPETATAESLRLWRIRDRDSDEVPLRIA